MATSPENGGGNMRTVGLALIALGLAAAVKGLIHARGTQSPMPQTGGWELLDFQVEDAQPAVDFIE